MLVQRAYGDQYARQMQRQERLAAIGQISGSIAHELRNPLNVIKTSIYCLTHGKSITEEKRSEHLQRMDRQVDVANGVISALSDFARLPTPSPDSVAVDQVVTEVLETLTIPAGVVVVRDIARDLVVAADRQQLAIVLSNLVRNGVEAMPHGGKLAISGRADAGGVSVSVIDTGVGIKPDRLGRLTEPLYTTKARGIGLGLAITRVIVERHRGTIRFSSEVDVGTEATVWMPSGAADAQDENQRRTE